MAGGEDKDKNGSKDSKNVNGKIKSSSDKSGDRKSSAKPSESSSKARTEVDKAPKRSTDGNKTDTENVSNAGVPVEGPVLEQILGQLSEISRQQVTLGIKFDEQDGRIKSLEDESNIKNASGSGMSKRLPIFPDKARNISDDWDSDDDEILGSIAFLGPEDEDEEDKEEGKEDLDEIIDGKEGKGVVPEQHEIDIFKKRCMFSDNYADDDWTRFKARNTLRYWTSKPEARDFVGQKVDMDCPDLRYKNKKKMEKDMLECQKYLGGVSIAQIRLAENMKDLIADAGITMGEFANPEIEMADSRQEAAQTMETVKERATNMLKTVAAIGKMTTFSYLKLLGMRRNQYLEATDRSKVARDMVKRLKPSTRFLFGDQIKSVCQTLKNGSQLSSQLQNMRHNGGGGGRGRGCGSFRGGNGGLRGYRGFRRGRGGRGRGNGKKDG